MTHPFFYSPSNYLPSIPHEGGTVHTAPIRACAPAGVGPAFSPPSSPVFTTAKAPKLRGDAELWARLIEQQNPTQTAMWCERSSLHCRSLA